jgi:hypothetical protein
MDFGTIHDLHVHAGEPVFDPPPRAIRRKKNGNGSGDQRRLPQVGADFVLKQEWVDCFAEMDLLRDGKFLRIEVAHGVPTVQETEEPIRD